MHEAEQDKQKPPAGGENISDGELADLLDRSGGHLEPKVKAGGIAGAVTVVLAYVAAQFGVDVPPEVAAALTAILTFLAGYLR